jgi:hypothetical protein
MKPGEGQAGPLLALATALLPTDALPELAHGDYPTAASLADNLRRGGTASVQPIASALARVAEDTQRERHADQAPKPVLVLLVDQFEELFAHGVSDAERAAFAESLRQLIGTGRVWVVATLRADLYELLLKQPALKALKETGASLDLGPPGPTELAEIVRAPAAAAGLVFETGTEKKGELGERLLADARPLIAYRCCSSRCGSSTSGERRSLARLGSRTRPTTSLAGLLARSRRKRSARCRACHRRPPPRYRGCCGGLPSRHETARP